MLAYAAHRRTRRSISPTMLTLIVGGHALAIGLLITAKMNPATVFTPGKTEIFDVPLPKPVEPPPPTPQPRAETPRPTDSFIEKPARVIELPRPSEAFEVGPPIGSGTPEIGEIIETPIPPVIPQPLPLPPKADPVRVQARAITPADLIRPAYPDSKVRSEEEAVLRLRLAIDARGRVTAVDPVGTADPVFLSAARSHLTRYWRYRPATEDGRAVATTLVITLRFELEE